MNIYTAQMLINKDREPFDPLQILADNLPELQREYNIKPLTETQRAAIKAINYIDKSFNSLAHALQTCTTSKQVYKAIRRNGCRILNQPSPHRYILSPEAYILHEYPNRYRLYVNGCRY